MVDAVAAAGFAAAARWHARRAWLPAGPAAGVLLEVEGGRLAAVTPGVDPPADARRLSGLVLPGLVNAHSHAFHRVLRGRTESGRGNFWHWREQMYAVAGRLEPDRYRRLARAVYGEMALAGITAVGEFHYLHHRPDGRPYDDPNVMGVALADAAADAGVRLTLLDTCYLRGGFDRPLEGVQRRFGDGDALRWAGRAAALQASGSVRVGAAVHSVRAVDAEAMAAVAAWAGERGVPLHLHLSEQPAENDACWAATGRTPAQLAADAGVLGARTVAVHATHLDAGDRSLLGGSATGVCLCPTTERSLADGVGPAGALRDAGSPLSLGSDSHAVVDLFEEARAIELDERLVSGRRGHHRPEDLLTAATAGGAAALGWDSGRLEPGRPADFVCVDADGPRLAGLGVADDASPGLTAAGVVFAATAADVTDVVVGGRPVVSDRRHVLLGDVGSLLREAVADALP